MRRLGIWAASERVLASSENFCPASEDWAGHTVVDGNNGWVEYSIPEITEQGSYELLIQYNAEEGRPLKLTVNDEIVTENAADGTTGTWKDKSMAREDKYGPFALAAGGSNKFRLDTDACFPHLVGSA